MEIKLKQQCEGCERTTCYHCNLCPHTNTMKKKDRHICVLCEKDIRA